jgi:hypothetical protein
MTGPVVIGLLVVAAWLGLFSDSDDSDSPEGPASSTSQESER